MSCTNNEFTIPLSSRLMSNTAEALDGYTKLAAKNNWKVIKLNVGPGKNFFSGVHPDVLRVMLKSGIAELSARKCVVYYPLSSPTHTRS